MDTGPRDLGPGFYDTPINMLLDPGVQSSGY
jgi:hypothetical protein